MKAAEFPARLHQQTVEEIARTQACENLLKDLGFNSSRVIHGDGMVRIRVSSQEIGRLIEPAVRQKIVEGLKKLGFTYVGLDLECLPVAPTPAIPAPPADDSQS